MGDRPNINHNVYILGAGFSANAGLPLVTNFLERMADAVEWLYSHDREREAESVRSVFDFRLRAAGAAYRAEVNIDNIEELFSLASASEGENRADEVISAIAATLDFAELTTQHPTCEVEVKEESDNGTWIRKEKTFPLYQLYAGIISGSMCNGPTETQNTVITLNYDTLLEDALAELDVPFHYGLPTKITTYHESAKCLNSKDRDTLPIYKLHGSVNWSKPSSRGRKTTVFGNYRNLYQNGGRVLLIPPTWRKIFAEQLVHVWEGAVEALNKATRIVVIGFSMPPTDNHFKYLIAAGLQRNISLRKFLFVNPGLDSKRKERAKLRRNLFSILRRELEARGVVEPIPLTAKEFFLRRETLRKIGRDISEDFLSINYLSDEFQTNLISELSLQ